MKTYEPCPQHRNGRSTYAENSPFCLECEIEALRTRNKQLEKENTELKRTLVDVADEVFPHEDKDELADVWA